MEKYLNPENIESLLTNFIIPWSVNIITAIVVFIIGKMIVKAIIKLLEKVLLRSHFDEILTRFSCSIIQSLLMLVVVVASLNRLGVDTTSLVALVGAAGIAVGLALKDSLQNFASGVMLLVFKPFKKGDYIDADGVEGVVDNISILTTTMHTLDNKEVILPNGGVFGSAITNYSSLPHRRIDLVIGVSYGDNMKQAKDVMLKVLEAHPKVLTEPAPQVAVCNLGDSSVDFVVRPWVESANYWDIRFEVIEQVKQALDDNSISIPFPQRDVHLFQASE